jgi:hypothetical protein
MVTHTSRQIPSRAHPFDRNGPVSGLRKPRMVLTLFAVTALAVLGIPAAATATPFPDNADGRIADSAGHAFCFESGFGAVEHRDVVYWATDYLGDATDMTTSVENCAGGTDVRFQAVNLPAGVRGDRECTVAISATECDVSRVRIDFGEIDQGDDDWYDRRKTAVHELGHTIGLGHHSPGAHDCAMFSGEVPSLDIKWRHYDSHDIGHINDTY